MKFYFNRFLKAFGVLFFVPHFLFAAPRNFADFINIFLDLINLLIPIIFALALVAFFWGISVFLFNADSSDKRVEGKEIMIWGVIALFVMVSVWGLVKIIQNTFF